MTTENQYSCEEAVNANDNSKFQKSIYNTLNIIDALDHVQDEAHKSHLSEAFWTECKDDISYLCNRLELNKNQVVLIAIMCELGESLSWKRLADFLGLSRLKAMAFTPDIEDLRNRRWIYSYASNERYNKYEGYKLAYGVIRAFRHNEKFEPERIDDLSEQAFVERIVKYVFTEMEDSNIPIGENHKWLLQMVEANQHLDLCKEINSLEDELSKIFLLLVIADYARYAGTENEGLYLTTIENLFEDRYAFDIMRDELKTKSHELFRRGIIEHGFDEGMVDTEQYILTERTKTNLLGQFMHRHRRNRNRNLNPLNSVLRKFSDVFEKELFYNPNERLLLQRIKSLLNQDGLKNVQTRLAERGLRRGVTCLFYGAPGTGKTESVLQLARETERDIIHINIAGLRDKYVGESEKNIMNIFKQYRDYCKGCDRMPILFFNEADAIINNRLETTHSSVEKMDNAMQNIILQELENLDGILIATTNLTGSLDKAFDRRFLFKVEFSRPGIDARKSIWHSMLPEVNETDCSILARDFDFSGGQIENIVRKCNIEYAISGVHPSISQIKEFCDEERLNRSNHIKIGF